MKRILMVLSVAALMVAMMGASAMPAFAKNVKFGEGGPPSLSGNPASTTVEHFNIPGEKKCVMVFNKQGIHGGCEDFGPPVEE